MRSRASRRFWSLFRNLPGRVRALAVKNYQLWLTDPDHPSLSLPPSAGQFGSLLRSCGRSLQGDWPHGNGRRSLGLDRHPCRVQPACARRVACSHARRLVSDVQNMMSAGPYAGRREHSLVQRAAPRVTRASSPFKGLDSGQLRIKSLLLPSLGANPQCPYRPTWTSATINDASLGKRRRMRLPLSLHLAPALHGFPHGDFVRELDVATHRNAHGDARHLHAQRFQ